MAGIISNPSFPRVPPMIWMLDSTSSTTRTQPAMVSVLMTGIRFSRVDRGSRRDFDGGNKTGEARQMAFQLCDDVALCQSDKRAGIGGQRIALSGLAERVELLPKGPRFVDRKAVPQQRPFGLEEAAQFDREHAPLHGAFRLR